MNSPPQQLAAAGGGICDSSNVSLQLGGGEESLQEKVTLLTPAKVLLDPPEQRTKVIAVPMAGGRLSPDKMAYCMWILPDLSFSAAQHAISPLSDLLVFACVFPSVGRLFTRCTAAFQKSCPLSGVL